MFPAKVNNKLTAIKKAALPQQKYKFGIFV